MDGRFGAGARETCNARGLGRGLNGGQRARPLVADERIEGPRAARRSLHGRRRAYLAYGPVRLRLRRVRFVGDLAVSGTVEWDRRARWVRARLRLSGAHNGLVRIGWPARATARLRGTLGGRAVRLRTPAP